MPLNKTFGFQTSQIWRRNINHAFWSADLILPNKTRDRCERQVLTYLDGADRGLLQVHIPIFAIFAGTDSKKPQKTTYNSQCTWKDSNWLPQEYKSLYRPAWRYYNDSETTTCRLYQSHHWPLNSHWEHRWNTDIEASDRYTNKKKETFLYSCWRYTQLEKHTSLSSLSIYRTSITCIL